MFSVTPLSQFSNWIIPYQQLYPNSAIGPQFLAASKHALKTLLGLGEKIVNYIYYIKYDHEKKTKKILRFPCFLASYCLSLDDKVNTITYQQFTLQLELNDGKLSPKQVKYRQVFPILS